jgi:hypothetical protein
LLSASHLSAVACAPRWKTRASPFPPGDNVPGGESPAFSPIAVGVPMLESFFACDDDYQWVLCRRNNSSLLLSAKARVNVEPPIVNAANLKAPGHLLPPDFEIERMLV